MELTFAVSGIFPETAKVSSINPLLSYVEGESEEAAGIVLCTAAAMAAVSEMSNV